MTEEFVQYSVDIFTKQMTLLSKACCDNMIDPDFLESCLPALKVKLDNIQELTNKLRSLESEQKQLLGKLQNQEFMKENECKSRKILEEAGVNIIEPTLPPVVEQKLEAKKNGEKSEKQEELEEETLFAPITQEEYSKVPDYMKGRLTAGIMNEILVKLAETLEKKHMLSKKKLSTLSLVDKNLVIKWRDEGKTLGKKAAENPLWCSEQEFRSHLSDKLKLAVIKGMQVLRHLKRVTETKVAGKNYIFAVCNK